MCEYLSKKKILIAVFVAMDEISGGSEKFTWKEICKTYTKFLKIIENF